MKKPWISAVLNFFLMGPGTLYNGKRKLFGLALTIGAIGLTYVELNVKSADANLYNIMFGSVFLMNIFFAWDGYREAKEINGETKAPVAA